MKYYNFFKKKPIFILASIFVVLSIIHIVYASLVCRGLVIDGILWFTKFLDKFSADGIGFYLGNGRTRMFINFINQLPVNLAYILGIHSKKILCIMYSLPLFLFPFLLLVYNSILAKRTKRYDIALIGLIIYGLFILPSIMYACVEVFFGSMLLLIFIHYYLADIDYKIPDIIFVILSSIVLYEGTELVVLICPFIILLKFFKRKNVLSLKQKLIKNYIELTVVLSSVYMSCVNLFVLNNEGDGAAFFQGLIQDRNNFILSLLREPFLLEIITILLFAALLFYRRKLGKISIILITSLYTGLFIFMLHNAMTYFYNFNYVSYRVFIFIAFPVLILFLFITEITRRYLHKNVLYNFLLIALICSIFNTAVQFVYSHKVGELITRYEQTISSVAKNIIVPEEDLENIYYAPDNIYFSTLFPTGYQLVFSKEYEQSRLVLPAVRDVSDIFQKIDFNFDNGIVYIFFTRLHIKNVFWDLTKAGKIYKNNEKFCDKHKFDFIPEDSFGYYGHKVRNE